jgi:hypothetical protein
MGDTINEYAILVGNSERKKTFERSRYRCEDETRMNLKTLKTRSYYRRLYRLAEHTININFVHRIYLWTSYCQCKERVRPQGVLTNWSVVSTV